jgi:hypothetical protein
MEISRTYYFSALLGLARRLEYTGFFVPFMDKELLRFDIVQCVA